MIKLQKKKHPHIRIIVRGYRTAIKCHLCGQADAYEIGQSKNMLHDLRAVQKMVADFEINHTHEKRIMAPASAGIDN